MSIKKTLFLISTIFCAALPIHAQSESLIRSPGLRITNNTDLDSTSVINSKRCSSDVLGEGGITRAHSTNEVSSIKIKLACGLNRENCTADVYMTANCNKSGQPPIARVILDVNKGIKSVVPANNSPFVLTFNGFDASISKK
ncbi:MAG TPA: hypothetical protein VL360_04165 [Gammaproteobacteria bacterium]|jgi:hypothetical protein|nr:hypothetical protein [Gammaproteobacteria bacterium]